MHLIGLLWAVAIVTLIGFIGLSFTDRHKARRDMAWISGILLAIAIYATLLSSLPK